MAASLITRLTLDKQTRFLQKISSNGNGPGACAVPTAYAGGSVGRAQRRWAGRLADLGIAIIEVVPGAQAASIGGALGGSCSSITYNPASIANDSTPASVVNTTGVLTPCTYLAAGQKTAVVTTAIPATVMGGAVYTV